MKTYKPNNKPESGSVLLVTLLITSMAGLVLASYLTLVGAQNASVVRSQGWNAAVPVIEAGFEEALAHLNNNCYSSDLTEMGRPLYWTADGWASLASGDGITKTTTLPDGSYTIITILTNSSAVPPASIAEPVIFSEGHVSASQLAFSRPESFFAVIGSDGANTQTTTPSKRPNPQVPRKGRVTAGNPGVFAFGIVALRDFNMNGNGVTTDSFDSSNPLYSTGGLYDSTKRRAHGDIATVSGLTNYVNLGLGNANIYGRALTGPGGTMDIGPNGSVGDLAWHNGGSSGVQTGYFSQDMNLSFPDVKAPFTGGFLTPTGGTLVTTNLTLASTSHLTNSYPSGKSPITTNYVITTGAYPASGTYFGTVMTNTLATTTVAYPASGTYIGLVGTNTTSNTTTNYPSSGTYLGTPATNTISATTSNYPSSGTYVGLVTTNTASTTSSNYPTSGTYVGTPATNTISTTSSNYPASGTYLGAVSTNLGSFTSTTYPSQHIGAVTTNTTFTSSQTAPAAGTYVGAVTIREVNNNKDKDQGTWYDYNKITGYTYYKAVSYTYGKINGWIYQKITGYGYNKIYAYTYEKITGYAYTRIVDYTYARITDWTWYTTIYTTNIASTTYDYILDTGRYLLANLSGTAYVRGDATLYVTTTLNFSGINIGREGRLRLYSAAPSATLAGNGVVNQPGRAKNLYFYGLPTCKVVTLSGNGGFTGCIYAPQADLTLNGGGNNEIDFIGAGVFRSISLNGHFNFHYDESLALDGPARGYTITSWKEVPLSETK
jgi:hypothetical protein